MPHFYALDIETAPIDQSIPSNRQAFALEPWSCNERSKITFIAVTDGTKYISIKEDELTEKLPKLLALLKGQMVFAANAVFDVSYLLKQSNDYAAIRAINWLDIQILAKWLQNGEDHRNELYPLTKCASTWIPEWPKLEEFLAMKKEGHDAGENQDYWDERGLMDVEATWLIANAQMKQLPKEQRKGFATQCKCIAPLSRSLVAGIRVDRAPLVDLEKYIKERSKELSEELKIDSKVLKSPKQLSNLIFGDWGLRPVSISEKTGVASVSADDLKKVAFTVKDKRLQKVLEWKKLETIQSKYIKGFKQARDYLDRDTIHGFPRIFATATGRMSYSSKLLKKFQTSIALHQIPSRDKIAKPIKQALVAPEGYGLVSFDFNSQEMRLAAIISQDDVLLDVYRTGKDVHSVLTAEIFGVPYAEVVEANRTGKPERLVQYRRAGKLTNLSSLYRISAPALKEKFFTMYDEDKSIIEVENYLRQYKRAYEGIPKFWDHSIHLAQLNGYTEALGGLRYYTKAREWVGQSNAINHRIQGSGASMTYLAISEIDEKFPDFILAFQVHDSLTYFAPLDKGLKEQAEALSKFLNEEIDYGAHWGMKLPIKLLADVNFGMNYAELEAI